MISVVTITRGPGSLSVAVGDVEKKFGINGKPPVSYFEVPFDVSTTGPVRLTLNGRTTYGPPITNECHYGQVRAAVSQYHEEMLICLGHLQPCRH